ncbi:hypothetical protein MNBD_CHLOROFLEXI01-688, partial [hydrothermal vent metagenome]
KTDWLIICKSAKISVMSWFPSCFSLIKKLYRVSNSFAFFSSYVWRRYCLTLAILYASPFLLIPVTLTIIKYSNSVVTYVNAAAIAKIEQGISDAAPDGFAIQAFGRVDAQQLSPEQRAQEPFLDLRRDEWGDAQAGFRVYQDWLNIINQFEYTTGKPVYINAANTFDSETGQTPTENYPVGWLGNALETIN